MDVITGNLLSELRCVDVAYVHVLYGWKGGILASELLHCC